MRRSQLCWTPNSSRWNRPATTTSAVNSSSHGYAARRVVQAQPWRASLNAYKSWSNAPYAAFVTEAEQFRVAQPRVAAGALFLDERGRVLLGHARYKDHWDLPGGYVEPGESPHQACRREVREELSIDVEIGGHLVVDWAPIESEGDKLLFIFEGGHLDRLESARLPDGELDAWRFIDPRTLDDYVPARLARRIRTAIQARSIGAATYAEHGVSMDGLRGPTRS
jgi:8-oxo-dGTP diphosphatase